MRISSAIVLVWILAFNAYAITMTNKVDVTGPGKFQTAYTNIPPTGADLRLEVKKSGGHNLVTCQIAQHGHHDELKWVHTTDTWPLHVFSAIGALSSREWLHLFGNFGGNPSGSGSGSGGAAGHNPPQNQQNAFDVYVAGVNIQLDGIAEDKEETEGARIRWNTTPAIPMTNDFIKLTIFPVQPTNYFRTGSIVLSKLEGGNKIRFRAKPDGTQPIANPSFETKTIDSSGTNIWVEGIARSGAIRDVAIQAQYTVRVMGQPEKIAKDTVRLTLINIAMKLEQVGNTVINAQNKYSEDTTIRVTAVDEQTGATLNWFTGDVTITELPQEEGVYKRIYSQNGGSLPALVKITAGGTTTFVAKSLAGPDEEKKGVQRKPNDAEITSGNYPFYGTPSHLTIEQWIDRERPHFPVAEEGVPDWFEYRTKDFFDAHVGGNVGTVLSKIASYRIDWVTLNQSPASGLASTDRGRKGTVTFNPYIDERIRLNSEGGTSYCVPKGKNHFNVILHEARHCYQGFIAGANDLANTNDDDNKPETPKNDDDLDWLVEVMPIAPTNIIVDSGAERDVWKAGDECHRAAYQGDGVKDDYKNADHKGVINAVEKDASEFARMHDQ